jgi:two-component system nitrate/nitrite response regulator NarL
VTEAAYPVLVVDDDAMVRGWVKMALEGSEFEVVAEAADAGELRGLLARRAPAVMLVDHRLPGTTGTELLRALRLEGVSTPAILMTSNEEGGFNEAARDAAAQGTVLKTGSHLELLAALRAVVSGGNMFDHRHPRRDPSRAALSPREREILRLVASGATNRQVAEELGVTAETVKTLLTRAFGKLGTTRRAEAVFEAHRLGLL